MKRRVYATTRLIHELFTQYQSTFLAFCELINNSIQAEAKNIRITIDYPSSEEMYVTAIRQIIVRDDGIGVPESELQTKLLDFGESGKKGGKGIGRFAALQLGSDVSIETVGYNADTNTFSRSTIPFSEQYFKSVRRIEDLVIDTDEQILDGNHSTYYQVTIKSIYDPVVTGKNQKRRISERLMPSNIEDAIFERYPLHIFNKSVKFWVNGNALNPEQFIRGTPEKVQSEFIDKKGKARPLFFTYIQLNSVISEIRIFLTTKNAGIDTIVSGFEFDADWLHPSSKGWFVYIHAEEFDTDIYRNLDLDGLDENTSLLKTFIKDKLNGFFKEKNKKYDDFISKLKKDNYYPYREPGKATSQAKVLLFDKVAYYVEERYNLFTVNKQLREIIYPLIDRTITNGELNTVLQQILRLDNKHVKQFNAVLQRAEIEDIIEFSEKVSLKLQHLDFVERITVTELAAHVAERKELHKVLEKMLWIFGEKYLENTKLLSDTNLENNLRELREATMIYKADKKLDNIFEVEPKVKSITDLFLYSEKLIDEERREVLVVELKAPKVRLGEKELNQVWTYAQQIEESAHYSELINFHIILIGSDIGKQARFRLKGIDKPRDNPYYFFENEAKNITISVMRWADVIESMKRKLSYLSSKLKLKDIGVEETINSDFEEIGFAKVRSTLRKVSIKG